MGGRLRVPGPPAAGHRANRALAPRRVAILQRAAPRLHAASGADTGRHRAPRIPVAAHVGLWRAPDGFARTGPDGWTDLRDRRPRSDRHGWRMAPVPLRAHAHG